VRYKTFAAQIECLAALLSADKKERAEILFEDELVFQLMTITQNFKTDPVLLTAVCSLTLKVC